MKRRYFRFFSKRIRHPSARASYTVEAAYVMTITLISLAVLIHTAYSRFRQETGIMRLHHMVELERGQWQEEERIFRVLGAEGQSERKKNTAEGRIRGDGWEKEISAKVHRPEVRMRMLTIFRGREEGGAHGGAE